MHEDKFEHGIRGEFRGDFTRDTFDPFRHFSRVLMQQGRVQIDADWNEQISIFMHYIRGVVRNIGSEHWGPCDENTNTCGFKITSIKNNDLIENSDKNFIIRSGCYYVQGLLCEVDKEKEIEGVDVRSSISYNKQPDYSLPEEKKFKLPDEGYKVLVYLDVWERHLSYVEDDYMREKALSGPDTATRAKVVWQVKLIEISSDVEADNIKDDYSKFLELLSTEEKPGSGMLRARARKKKNGNEPCLTPPESLYRGAENQLYRVEIHNGGTVGDSSEDKITFKWSRENGSVIFPIDDAKGKVVTLEHLGRDDRFGLKKNDWVEIVDDDYILQNRADPLLQVIEVSHDNFQVTLSGSPTFRKDKHPYLRRWDHTGKIGDLSSGAIEIKESSGEDDKDWLQLEDGVQVQFFLPEISKTHTYHTGDYWLIPARTATGDVEWPGNETGKPEALAPHGVKHHYAPLAIIDSDGKIGNLQRKLIQTWE